MTQRQGWPLWAFLLVQVIDGGLTYLGIMWYGLAVEENPLIALAIWGWGPFLGLSWIKASAAALGVAIYAHGKNWTWWALNLLSGAHCLAWTWGLYFEGLFL